MKQQKLDQLTLARNFSFFVSQAFATVSPGTPYLSNWHIDLIASKLADIENGKINRLIINIPPRYLKSICVSVAWPAWLMGHNPSNRIMASSYSQTLSNKHSQDCRLIMQSDWYKELFPATQIKKGENQKSKFVTTQRGYRFATSTGGTATGEGGDILIADDPQNPNKINSKKYRQATIEWFEQTFISRLNDKKKGAIVIIMQRLHEDDLCGYLLKNKKKQWDLLKLPAYTEQKISYFYPQKIPLFGEQNFFSLEQHFRNRSENDLKTIAKFIHPPTYSNISETELYQERTTKVAMEKYCSLHQEREDPTDIMKIKSELGDYVFNAQYLQSPVPSKGNMIKRSWLKYFSNTPPIEYNIIVQSWDTAIKAKNENDYSVCVTLAVSNDNYYILDITREKLEFPELVIAVKNNTLKWQPHAVLVEDAASGQSLIQTLKTNFKTAIIPIKPKFDKITRFAKHTVLFESGRIFIDRHSNWRMNFEEELLSFPNSAHDDQIDSLSQALNYLEQKTNLQIRKL